MKQLFKGQQLTQIIMIVTAIHRTAQLAILKYRNITQLKQLF